MYRWRVLLVFILLFLAVSVLAQNSTATLPQLIRFSGSIRNTDGSPRTGIVGVTFALYKDNEGGAPVWQEVQNVLLDADGHYSVMLGQQSKEGLPVAVFASGETRWLGVQPEGQREQSRILLVSVPYALKAGDAETLGGLPLSAFLLNPLALPGGTTAATSEGSGNYINTATLRNALSPTVTGSGTTNKLPKWLDTNGTLGNSAVYEANGKVGINTTAPVGILDVFTDNAAGYIALTPSNINLYDKGFLVRASRGPMGTPATVAQGDVLFNLYAQGYTGPGYAIGGGISMQVDGTVVTGKVPGRLIFETSDANGSFAERMRINSLGRVGIGTTAPSSALTVAGTVESTTGGFKFPNATIQTKAGVTNVTVNSGISGGGGPDVNGNVTIAADYNAVQGRVTGTCPSGTAVGSISANGNVSCNTASGGGPLALPYSASASDNPPTTQGTFRVTDTATGPPPPQNGPPVLNTIPSALVGVASGSNIVAGVVGEAIQPYGVPIVAVNTSSTGAEVPIIFAWSQATSGTATLFNGQASSAGANGIKLDFDVTPQDSIQVMVGTSGNRNEIFDVDGSGNIFASGNISANGNINLNNGSVNVGGGTYYGTNVNVGNVNASGNIHANGTISAPTKNFRIDHPLDPGNKWLYHTSVESPDMKDLYDGVVQLDQHGEAWVTMPEWFEALNRDFRYQLTAIGAPGPKLYISQKMSGNRFKIAGGKKGMEVSWLVTGIRQDAWATDNRTVVEQDKVGSEVGAYYHPKTITPANSDANAKVNSTH